MAKVIIVAGGTPEELDQKTSVFRDLHGTIAPQLSYGRDIKEIYVLDRVAIMKVREPERKDAVLADLDKMLREPYPVAVATLPKPADSFWKGKGDAQLREIINRIRPNIDRGEIEVIDSTTYPDPQSLSEAIMEKLYINAGIKRGAAKRERPKYPIIGHDEIVIPLIGNPMSVLDSIRLTTPKPDIGHMPLHLALTTLKPADLDDVDVVIDKILSGLDDDSIIRRNIKYFTEVVPAQNWEELLYNAARGKVVDNLDQVIASSRAVVAANEAKRVTPIGEKRVLALQNILDTSPFCPELFRSLLSLASAGIVLFDNSTKLGFSKRTISKVAYFQSPVSKDPDDLGMNIAGAVFNLFPPRIVEQIEDGLEEKAKREFEKKLTGNTYYENVAKGIGPLDLLIGRRIGFLHGWLHNSEYDTERVKKDFPINYLIYQKFIRFAEVGLVELGGELPALDVTPPPQTQVDPPKVNLDKFRERQAAVRSGLASEVGTRRGGSIGYSLEPAQVIAKKIIAEATRDDAHPGLKYLEGGEHGRGG